MIAALVTGTLFRAPGSRTSKAGKRFAVATIRIKDGERVQFVRCTAFSETVQTELMRVADGDAVSVQGRRKNARLRPRKRPPRRTPGRAKSGLPAHGPPRPAILTIRFRF